MKITSPLLLFLLCLFASATSLAQTPEIDSLQKVISTLPDDTAKVNRLADLVGKYQYLDPAKAVATSEEAIRLSQKINYTLGLAIAYRLRGVTYVDKTILDSGKLFYDKAWVLVKDHKEKTFLKQAALITHNYGVIHNHLQQYDLATAKYLEAARIFHDIGEDALSFPPYNNLSYIYNMLGNYEKSIFYANECYKIGVKLNDLGKIGFSINSIASARIQLKQFDSAIQPLRTNLVRGAQIKNNLILCRSHNLLAQCFSDGTKQYDSATYHYKQSLVYAKALNNQFEIASSLHNIGHGYIMGGQYDSAIVYLKRTIEFAKPLQLDQVVQYATASLVDAEELKGDTTKAYRYLKDYLTITDTIRNRNNRAAVDELEAKFQTEKKELQINQLQSEKKAQALVNYSIIGGAVALVVVSLLVFRNYKQKQKLQQQRINDLETQQQLLATEAVLKGEEQERTRLAKDLHDGLGGMLSGIKYSFNTMKANLVMTPENHQAFERSMDMLDSSIKEMRRVAHNMMPEALVKFGLDTALKDFCNDINQSGALEVSYQSIDMQNAVIEQTTSITIFRIVQELVNNIIKHAAAKTAIVQVTKTNGAISITVEDDGKGFDTAVLQRVKGIGWSNIQSRIDYLKGKTDIQSSAGKGTSVHIELTA